MSISRAAVFAVLLLAAAPAAQDEQKPPAFGGTWNAAVGLGGGAGGIYGMRGGGLEALKARDSRAGARIEAAYARLGDHGEWFETDAEGDLVFPGPERIEATAWALLAFSTSSTMRSGPYREGCKSAAAALISLLDGAGGLQTEAKGGADLRRQALAAWALAETARVSAYRVLSAKVEVFAERLEDLQLDDGSLPAVVGEDRGDPATTAFALHAWRTHRRLVGEPEAGTPSAAALTWLRGQADPQTGTGAGTGGDAAEQPGPVVEAVRLLLAEQELLGGMLSPAQIENLPSDIPPLDAGHLDRWRSTPELRLAALTVAGSLPAEFWEPVWRTVRVEALERDLEAAGVGGLARTALELAAPYRYVTRR